MSLLEVENLSQNFADKTLYKEASFDVYKGEHLGIVGRNGAGKSTLMNILLGKILPDNGSVKWRSNIKIGYLDQHAEVDLTKTIHEYLRTAFSNLIAKEKEMNILYQAGTMEKLERAATLQEELLTQGFYDLETEIQKVASGLGIQAIGLKRTLATLSGGQRAKVILAKLLLTKPDVLLLDEPTNFLDAEHIDWLINELNFFPGAYLVISHDFAFLEKITTAILDIEFGTIKKYHGSYAAFLKQKAHLREEYERQYTKQQQKISATEAYIRKNKAGVNSKMARGREKQLNRMERLAAPEHYHQPVIEFQSASPVIGQVLATKDLVIGYDKPLLTPLNITLRAGEKVVVTGFNGIGKSTLLKTILGERAKLGGEVKLAHQAKIDYFAQELFWQNDQVTPLAIIQAEYPRMLPKEIRKVLARVGMKTDHITREIRTLSGGEQSKVKLARLVLQPANFLIFDEPTNHLDEASKEALKKALIAFKGSVLLVSHERAFYDTWIDREIPVAGLV